MSYDDNNHAFEVMETSQDYDCLKPAWYLEKHTAQGTTTSHLHFPHCSAECYGQGKIYPEYSITYDEQVALDRNAIHNRALVQNSSTMLERLPKCYHE